MDQQGKICPRCAETVKGAAQVCRYCAHEFASEPISTSGPIIDPEPSTWLPPGASSEVTSKQSQPPRKTNNVLGCLGLIALIAVIVKCSQDAPLPPTTEPTAKTADLDSSTNAVTSFPIDEKPKSNWTVTSSTDELRGKAIHYASVSSSNSVEFDFPYNGGSSLTMTVRRHPQYGDDVVFQISKGQFTCGIDNCRGNINFGDGAQRINLSTPEDHSSDTLFATSGGSIISKLKKSNRVIVELPFYQEGNQQFTFDTNGLLWPPK